MLPDSHHHQVLKDAPRFCPSVLLAVMRKATVLFLTHTNGQIPFFNRLLRACSHTQTCNK